MGRKFGREMCGVLPFRSDKTGTLHPTMSAVPLPDATLTRLIRPTGPEHRTVGWIRRFTLHPATVVGA